MRKKILYIAAVVICLSIITSGTLAYFTAEDTARNVITSGSVDVAVVEQQLINGTLQTYPDQPTPVMPGTTVSKIVSVQSMDQAAWIRANYTVTIYDADGRQMEISGAELAKVVLIKPDSVNWTLKNGWWYYNAACKAGETTKPLFEAVEFSGPEMGNEYQRCTVTIDIHAQAVQQANNGSTVMEAAGWPEE